MKDGRLISFKYYILENEGFLETHLGIGERGGLVVNASDSGSRGRRFEPHSGQTVLCP